MEENKTRRSRAQRRKKRKKKIGIKIIQYFILLVIISILSYMACGIYQEGKIKTILSESNIENDIGNLTVEEQKSIAENTKKIKIPSVPVSQKYLGHTVESRLEVPKIKLNTNVLLNYSTEGLKVCASKYYGPNANEVGNYCIAGHNYNQENMFNHLIDLKIGDSIFLTDNQNGVVEYEIYDIYKVKPENTTPLSQKTGGKREITLITCVNYSTRRLVVKATER